LDQDLFIFYPLHLWCICIWNYVCCTNVVEHEINVTDPTLFKDEYIRIPPSMFEEVREHLRSMVEARAIRKPHSPFSSNGIIDANTIKC
jgi:hypothetical protein